MHIATWMARHEHRVHQLHDGGEDKKRTALVNILHPLVRGTPSDRGPLPVTKRPFKNERFSVGVTNFLIAVHMSQMRFAV